MACVLVPAAEAIITTVITKVVESKEKKAEIKTADIETEKIETNTIESDIKVKIPFSRKLKWLNNMLWGGSILLIFEHIWHGEIVPWFPFLTAAANPADAAEMLHEMATVGVTMACLVTLVWLGMVAVTSLMEKRTEKEKTVKGNEA